MVLSSTVEILWGGDEGLALPRPIFILHHREELVAEAKDAGRNVFAQPQLQSILRCPILLSEVIDSCAYTDVPFPLSVR
jgi:hypothetical protein